MCGPPRVRRTLRYLTSERERSRAVFGARRRPLSAPARRPARGLPTGHIATPVAALTLCALALRLTAEMRSLLRRICVS